jgi:hypothetical protein
MERYRNDPLQFGGEGRAPLVLSNQR